MDWAMDGDPVALHRCIVVELGLDPIQPSDHEASFSAYRAESALFYAHMLLERL